MDSSPVHDPAHMVLQELHKEGASVAVVLALIWRVPLLWVAVIVIRAVCILLMNPLFRYAGQRAPQTACVIAHERVIVIASRVPRA